MSTPPMWLQHLAHVYVAFVFSSQLIAIINFRKLYNNLRTNEAMRKAQFKHEMTVAAIIQLSIEVAIVLLLVGIGITEIAIVYENMMFLWVVHFIIVVGAWIRICVEYVKARRAITAGTNFNIKTQNQLCC